MRNKKGSCSCTELCILNDKENSHQTHEILTCAASVLVPSSIPSIIITIACVAPAVGHSVRAQRSTEVTGVKTASTDVFEVIIITVALRVGVGLGAAIVEK